MENPAAAPTESPSDDSSPRLQAAVAEYFERLERGENPERAAMLDRYADVAGDLAEFFADHDRLSSLAAPLRPAAQLRLHFIWPDPQRRRPVQRG